MYALNLVLFACFFALVKSQGVCKNFGEWCDGTVFNRCCGNLQCELTGAFNGVCVFCLNKNHMCLHDSECCSGKCHWYKILL
ncbi:unnamed protein product [Hymenolepis diminuta]|uniref:UPF0506 domain-containing protein n=1 Tax=Hymenolepis diminuta TaxID=6216 RepID=A0A0R3SCK3_HYMDI|nr:unnamed protein product [Hymenolepis diminuta]